MNINKDLAYNKLEEVEQNLSNMMREYLDKVIKQEDIPDLERQFYLGIDYALIQIRHALEDIRGIK